MSINQHNPIALIFTTLSLLGIIALTCAACLCGPINLAPTPPPAPLLPTMIYDEYVPTFADFVDEEANTAEEPITISSTATATKEYEYVPAPPVVVEEVIVEELIIATRQARYTLTAAEKHMLKFVADREDSHSVESRLAVMQVVMNRVNDSRFPNTVRDVLFQRNQFHVMPRYHTSYVPSAQAAEALERLLYDACVFGGANAIFFAASRVSPDRIARRLYLIAEIGGSRFWGQRQG